MPAIISAGAAKGLVEAVAAQQGLALDAAFGAVGAMKAKLLSGAACEVLILTQVLLEDLAASGEVDAATICPLGWVHTGIAVPAGAPHPPIGDGGALARALGSASAIYLPDPQLATAGIHFAKVLERLGIAAAVSGRLRPFPNGATAMRAMADSGDLFAVGCTQATEILYTPGVELVGLLPEGFGLATLYSAAVATRSRDAAAARALIAQLAGPETEARRRQGGFAPS